MIQIPIDRPCDDCLGVFSERLTPTLTGCEGVFCEHRRVAVIAIVIGGVIGDRWLIRPAMDEAQARALLREQRAVFAALHGSLQPRH
ncbi:MAG: hypothetical protein IT496_01620 [Gammaproteobacteria bacterium]|nr:hypothetical protein [Gammaproteobacteria bacterium]